MEALALKNPSRKLSIKDAKGCKDIGEIMRKFNERNQENCALVQNFKVRIYEN